VHFARNKPPILCRRFFCRKLVASMTRDVQMHNFRPNGPTDFGYVIF
jgi:hypothetical protein